MVGGAVQQWGSQHMEIERCEASVSPLGMVSSTASPAGGTQLRPDPPATELSPGGVQGGHCHSEMSHNRMLSFAQPTPTRDLLI